VNHLRTFTAGDAVALHLTAGRKLPAIKPGAQFTLYCLGVALFGLLVT
jgi:hypothetical protein